MRLPEPPRQVPLNLAQHQTAVAANDRPSKLPELAPRWHHTLTATAAASPKTEELASVHTAMDAAELSGVRRTPCPCDLPQKHPHHTAKSPAAEPALMPEQMAENHSVNPAESVLQPADSFPPADHNDRLHPFRQH